MKWVSWIICLLVTAVSVAQRPVQGTVIDENNGEPIAGATIIVGGNLSVSSDEKGRFQLKAADSVILQVSAIGYQNKRSALVTEFRCSSCSGLPKRKWMPWWYQVPCGP